MCPKYINTFMREPEMIKLVQTFEKQNFRYSLRNAFFYQNDNKLLV